MGRRTFRNLVYVFQAFCSIVGSFPKILGMRIRTCGSQCRIVGLEVFGFEDFSKFGLCVSRFLLHCRVPPKHFRHENKDM